MSFKFTISTTFILLFSICFSFGQINLEDKIELCSTDKKERELEMSDPEYPAVKQKYEQAYQKHVKARDKEELKLMMVYTLPVVVHIIHDGAALGTEENPTDATIVSDIQTTSNRLRHMHPGADTYTNPNYGADTEIELCLATEDPLGNYTTGIVRHYDPINTMDPSSAYLNSIEWDDDLYMNIFIAKDIGGPCGYYTGGGNDYTVYLASCWWSGLIAHELGHYFSLIHTFAGVCENTDCTAQGDQVCDTPPKMTSGFTYAPPPNDNDPCNFPGNSCTTDEDDTSINNPYRPIGMGGMGEQPDNLSNYLDYTGSCWDSYTEGQKTRMRFNIDNSRVNLKNNSAACAPATADYDAGISSISLTQSSACDSSIEAVVTINNYGEITLTSVDIEVYVNGTLNLTEPWTGSIVTGANSSYSLTSTITLPIGISSIRIQTSNPNGQTDANIHSDMDYRSATFVGGTYCESFSGCSTINPSSASGPGNMTLVNVAGTFPTAAPGSTSVQICATVFGDSSFGGEVWNMIDESGNTLGTTVFGSDCDLTSPSCFYVPVADYNTWRGDGNISMNFDPISTDINPLLCDTNEICVTVTVPLTDSTCEESLTLASTVVSGTYSAIDFVETSNPTNFNSGTDVTISAGSYIELSIGTTIETGAEFLVNIQVCF